MASEPSIKAPPYPSHVSFQNYVEHLGGKPLPSRIDKTVMAHLNYGTQQALLSGLRTLGFIGEGDAPTELLDRLVNATGEDRQAVLKQAIAVAYPYLMDGSIDLSRATLGELQARIREATGAQGTTIDKACSFLFGIAADAGMELSPHFVARKAGTSAPKRVKKLRKPKKVVEQDTRKTDDPKPPIGLADQLMAKFPTFDPEWPDALKEKWFTSFEKLMKSAEKSGHL